MKKVIALIGSARKKATYEAVREFERNLKTYGEIDFETVFLNEYRLEFCQGCKLCFGKGAEFCPFHDDRDILLDKILNSDGVVFAVPNYSFHISARMKNFFDRIAFLFHRPCFFGKTSTSIVTQGFFGGGTIIKYLGNVGRNWGFKVTKGCVLNSLEPSTEATHKRNSKKIRKASERFYRELMSPALPSPSLFRLMLFRMSRTSMRLLLNDESYDYRYYKGKGWFESDYYYDAPIGPLKRLLGNLFDFFGRRIFKQPSK